MKKYKFDGSIWSEAEIDREMVAAEREAKKMTRADLASYYVCAIGNTHYLINERNRLLRKVSKLERQVQARKRK